jgi:hypothetical protein
MCFGGRSYSNVLLIIDQFSVEIHSIVVHEFCEEFQFDFDVDCLLKIVQFYVMSGFARLNARGIK